MKPMLLLHVLTMTLGIACASTQATAIDASALILGIQDSTETAASDTATDSDLKKWYVQIGGGYTFYSSDVDLELFWGLSSGHGWSGSVRSGYRFSDWLALEGSISYDYMTYDDGSGSFPTYTFSSKIKAVNLTIGPAFEFEIAKPVAFYISPQVGVSIAQGSTAIQNPGSFNYQSSTGDWKGLFAYELRAGFLFELSAMIDLYVGYRLNGIAGGVEMNTTQSGLVEESDPLNNGIEVGLRFNF